MVQGLLFKVGVPVADYDLVLVEESKVQHSWSVIVDCVRSQCVGCVCKMKICYIVDVWQVLGPLGGLAASLPSGVVLVHVTCD